jgi:Carboxypeptidase regulatory-like domain
MKPTLAWFLLELILATTVAHAQGIGSSGNINGTVTDPTGAVLPKATVIVLDTRTGLRRTAATDTTGQFQVTNLFPGTYDVTAEVSGFASEIRRGVVVSVGQTAITDFQMKPYVSTLVEVLDEVVWSNNWKVLRRRRFQLPSRLPVSPAW